MKNINDHVVATKGMARHSYSFNFLHKNTEMCSFTQDDQEEDRLLLGQDNL